MFQGNAGAVLLGMLQEIDSIEVSKAEAAASSEDGIDGIPIPTDNDTAAAVTAEPDIDSEKKVSAKVSRKTSSQPANDVDSDDEDKWKDVPPQGLSAVTAAFCLHLTGLVLKQCSPFLQLTATELSLLSGG